MTSEHFRTKFSLRVSKKHMQFPWNTPRFRGPSTDHFDGERFHPDWEVEPRGLREFLKWMRSRQRGEWRPYREFPHGAAPPQRVEGNVTRVTFIGHATLLVQVAGVNILTDPIYEKRASPFTFAGPCRRRNPGIRFEDLPPVDIVFLSHNHHDHCNLVTLRRLHREHRPRVVTPLGNGELLRRGGIPGAEELDWWEQVTIGGVTLTAIPAQHWSARGLGDRNRALWAGMVLEGAAGRVLYTGDTAFGPHLDRIAARWPEGFDVALLPIGAYLPRWFMKTAHCTPEEAVQMHRMLRVRTSIPMHYGTFDLGDDGQDDALRDLAEARRTLGVSEQEFPVLEHGEGRNFPLEVLGGGGNALPVERPDFR